MIRVAPAGRTCCAGVGLPMGRPVAMCGGLQGVGVLAFATAGGAARWCELDVMRGGLVAPPDPERLLWFGRTVGVQLGTGFFRRKSRRLHAGGDDDGIRGCRSPCWGRHLGVHPFCANSSR